VIYDALLGDLPASFFDAQLARNYNLLTGATLSHLDFRKMSMDEVDEIRMLVEHSGMLF